MNTIGTLLKQKLTPETRVVSYGYEFPSWHSKKTISTRNDRDASKFFIYEI